MRMLFDDHLIVAGLARDRIAKMQLRRLNVSSAMLAAHAGAATAQCIIVTNIASVRHKCAFLRRRRSDLAPGPITAHVIARAMRKEAVTRQRGQRPRNAKVLRMQLRLTLQRRGRRR
jgi:hypothetical protein